MNGFKPVGDLLNWHLWLIGFLCGIGAIALLFGIVLGFIWIFNHVTFIIK